MRRVRRLAQLSVRHGRNAVMLLLLLTPGLVASGWAGPTQREAAEARIKAAYLYNFMKFVTWPESAAGDSTDPMKLCVLGRDPFGAVLDDTVREKRVRGRVIEVRRLDGSSEAKGCHVLFVASSEQARLTELLSRMTGQSWLTVSDIDGFAEQGGVVQLRQREEVVEFTINLTELQRAGLRADSQLLELGRLIQPPAIGTRP